MTALLIDLGLFAVWFIVAVAIVNAGTKHEIKKGKK